MQTDSAVYRPNMANGGLVVFPATIVSATPVVILSPLVVTTPILVFTPFLASSNGPVNIDHLKTGSRGTRMLKSLPRN